MFELKPWDADLYRQQTRRSTLIIAVVFLALAMLLSSLAVMLFGTPGADNFRFNLGGVIVAVLVMVALMRLYLWTQPWMAAAVYGWQLKRSLMRVTNVMHQVKAGVQARDPVAMRLLRFYHLGLDQMHQLDANSSDQGTLAREADEHVERMQEQGLDIGQSYLDPAWIDALKSTDTQR
ncbi:DUF3087 domain-containing protein [Pseudomonas corrugata]|uniref:DUF3087 domain-containing protein n=1 Tax=Pseudomonas corrugata TaxID=47879 RepID=A0A3M3EU09_9PSED|nr:DUF3087 family protein [Pseudomonas corrugata]AOE61110.1 hypothetical protein AXG94_04745 [Pseudomonas corrugata]MDU9035313.1 DUF3087 family protein [Pseudomonas corrugata]QTH12264.1 DUF3087 domain-containing protein [Pseudomonas corrugata]RMM53103.1 hypothetical protein ALQ77_00109 [Pseudomonas corrugata]UZD93388.1 DUF3087 domain-containing protein [Pseudomonas corrugata]